MILLANTTNVGILMLSAVFIAIGFGTLISCGQAIAVNATEKHRCGLAISTFFICCDGGMNIGPVILGMMIPSFGYKGMYICCAACIILSAGIYFLLHGRKNKAVCILSDVDLTDE